MMVHSGLPDADVSVEEEIAEGDKVVIRWTLRCTHMSELMGIPPTGKQVTWTGITIYRLADGKIVEEKGEEDSLGLMRQLGAVPTLTQAR
jgi:predicted ester cyclase